MLSTIDLSSFTAALADAASSVALALGTVVGAALGAGISIGAGLLLWRIFRRISIQRDFAQWRSDRQNFVTHFVPGSERFSPGYRKRRQAEIDARN